MRPVSATKRKTVPLPPPAPRKTMHQRRVQFTGYQREDGLWDIEAELLDSKPHAFEVEGEARWAPDEPIHHMRIRLTIDEQLVVARHRRGHGGRAARPLSTRPPRRCRP